MCEPRSLPVVAGDSILRIAMSSRVPSSQLLRCHCQPRDAPGEDGWETRARMLISQESQCVERMGIPSAQIVSPGGADRNPRCNDIWTTQPRAEKLSAPKNVNVYCQKIGTLVGTKQSLRHILSAMTGLSSHHLSMPDFIFRASISERMSWAPERMTARQEAHGRFTAQCLRHQVACPSSTARAAWKRFATACKKKPPGVHGSDHLFLRVAQKLGRLAKCVCDVTG